VVNLVQRGKASIVRIHELLSAVPAIDDRDANPALATAEIDGTIDFDDLHFTYPSESGTGPEVLRGITLHVPAGSSLALVGPTGAGKSTLASLIARLYEAPAGTMRVDGHPVNTYPLDTLRSQMGYVPQETFLFSTTIRDNIALGRPNATETELLDAAEAAHIRREFEEFPAGFDTKIGERGLTLSGGQKQRSALARALIREPRILILDDALASVDTYTEEQILNGLRRVMQGRTTVLISHRVSTIRHADQIAVILGGRIAELGTHEALLAEGGYYASLFEKQMLEEEIAVTT
jgi:ATP-binding cassette subfamily B protein